MPRLIITEDAAAGLARCQQFLQGKNPKAAAHAAKMIWHRFKQLEKEPQIGRPFDPYPIFRELIIPFGESGYIALYHIDTENSLVIIVAFRHQKETGYRYP